MTDPDSIRMRTTSLDDCEGEIFHRYLIGKKMLKEVMTIIEKAYGFTTTAAIYKARLEKSGYQKNTKRHIVNILFHRKEYTKVEEQATIWIRRARTIEGDAWRRFYSLVKGGYYLGMTQYHTENYVAATKTLSSCLEWEAELWKVDNTGQFDSEKVGILERLEAMALWTGQLDEDAKCRSKRLQVLEQIQSSEPD